MQVSTMNTKIGGTMGAFCERKWNSWWQTRSKFWTGGKYILPRKLIYRTVIVYSSVVYGAMSSAGSRCSVIPAYWGGKLFRDWHRQQVQERVRISNWKARGKCDKQLLGFGSTLEQSSRRSSTGNQFAYCIVKGMTCGLCPNAVYPCNWSSLYWGDKWHELYLQYSTKTSVPSSFFVKCLAHAYALSPIRDHYMKPGQPKCWNSDWSGITQGQAC